MMKLLQLKPNEISTYGVFFFFFFSLTLVSDIVCFSVIISLNVVCCVSFLVLFVVFGRLSEFSLTCFTTSSKLHIAHFCSSAATAVRLNSLKRPERKTIKGRGREKDGGEKCDYKRGMSVLFSHASKSSPLSSSVRDALVRRGCDVGFASLCFLKMLFNYFLKN